jgi:hypothetical protein
LWVRGLPENCSTADILVRIEGRELPSVFVSDRDSAALRQVNALLPAGLSLGWADLNVAVGDSVTPPAQVQLVSPFS